MTIEELKQLALDCGFHHVGDLDADTIEMHVEARDACAENKCHSYGKNWNCPPGCGTLEEEAGWCVYAVCADCGCRTAEMEYKGEEDKLRAAGLVADLWNMGKVISHNPGE